ncbi:MAG: thioredoxin family protein [Desulfurococcaceae archaeon]
MMWVFLFLPILAFGFFDRPVDYFGTKKEDKALEEKAKEKIEEREEDEYKRLWEEAQRWFPETTNPLERAFYERPNDPKIIEMLDRFYLERQERAALLASRILERQETRELAIRRKLSEYQVIYFYRPDCPYCRASEQYTPIFAYAKQFLRVDLSLPENARYVMQYRIRGVPTFIFMKDRKEVARWEGLWIYPSERAIKFLMELP